MTTGSSTLDAAVGAAVALVVAALMEPWARLLHGRVWHHQLWGIHRSHHEPRQGRFERNDALSLLHAPVAAGLVIAGCQASGLASALLVGAGAGMTLFGVGYVLVHDGLVHERLPVTSLMKLRLFRRIRGAHLLHHRTGGPPYGLFRGPEELTRLRRARPGTSASPTGPRPTVRAPS